jgi:glycosyltransferase involved in cell wall biosynthesis
MIKDRDFIVFSDDWGRHPCSCQHLIQRFLPHNRVLWVNTIGMRPPRVSLYDFRRSFEKLGSWLTPSADLPGNLSIANPFSIPYNMVPAVRKLNARIGLSALKSKVRQSGLMNPIVITTLPNTADFIGQLDEVLSIYYCVDEFAAYPDLPHKLVMEMEGELLKKVDLVITTSGELQKRKSNGIRSSLLIPHGVDVEHFAGRPTAATPATAALAVLPRPVVGFFGVINDWVDLALIDRMAGLRKDWSWVLIGPHQTNTDILRKHSNVVLLGKVPYETLPGYAACFDVGIIPFVVNDLTINVNPLKLLEYLACGLPVVSTPIPEAAKYGKLVSIAGTPEAFVSAIESLLGENTCEKITERISVARSNSWDSRAEVLSAHIDQMLETRTQCV